MIALRRVLLRAPPVVPIARVEHLEQQRLDRLVGLAAGEDRADIADRTADGRRCRAGLAGRVLLHPSCTASSLSPTASVQADHTRVYVTHPGSISSSTNLTACSLNSAVYSFFAGIL